MAATGATPISLYYSATSTNTPTAGNLVAGELAINTADGKLFYKDSGGVVQTIATKGGVNGTSSGQVLFNSSGAIGGSNNLFWDNTNARLGIGTASPTTILDVAGNMVLSGTSGYKYLYFNSVTESSSLRFAKIGKNYDSTFDLGFWASTHTAGNSAATVFYRDLTTESMRIDSSGYVGIGVTPNAWGGGYKVAQVANGALWGSGGLTHLSSNTYYDGTNYKYIISDYATDYYQLSGTHVWRYASASPVAGGTAVFNEAMRIDLSGNLLVGQTSSGAVASGGFCSTPGGTSNFVINHSTAAASGSAYEYFCYNAGIIGSITQAGTTAVLYNTTSDYRLKSDVTPIKNALATVQALNPVTFTWIDGRLDDGFLAHELQAVISNCVTGEKDAVNEDGTPKYQQMDSSGVIPFLVKAIQELKAEIDLLKGAK
jgi:hypothetical protein